MHIGVCYYPEHTNPENLTEDARRMKALGIRYVRLAEFSWALVEPERDRFTFDWLDRSLDILAGAGLDVVMCTPTATPPKWLLDEHPGILAVDQNGHKRGFGSRRHYSFSSPEYLKEALRISEHFAKRYGQHSAVKVWQTDNEYGCHDTVLCYSAAALTAFREWLQKKYTRIEALNEAWGNTFWSMMLPSFDSVELPNLTVTEANPAQRLDFWRFSSDQVIRFNRAQAAVIRQHSPGRPVTHNSMGLFFDYDHYKLAEDLDFLAWDNYPLGFLAVSPAYGATERKTYLRTGHPDLSCFMHDLFRGQSALRKFWVMEQQPGPVNWAPYNPVPAKNIVALWAWQCFAHGAETVSYFRWNRCAFGQEQEHAGLNYVSGGFTPFAAEVGEVARMLPAVEQATVPQENPAVALVFDYEAVWRLTIQPQTVDFNPVRLYLNFYTALRRLGLNIDIVPPNADIGAYSMVVVPCLPYADETCTNNLIDSEAVIICGPRCFSKTESFQESREPTPYRLSKLLNNAVACSEGLPAGIEETVSYAGKTYPFSVWREYFRSASDGPVTFDDQSPAALCHSNLTYLGFFPEVDFLVDYMYDRLPPVLQSHAVKALPAGIRCRRRDNLIYYFNTAEAAYVIPLGNSQEVIYGSQTLQTNNVTIIRQS